MNAVAQALADPIRRQILRLLRSRPATAGAIAGAFPVSRPAVSRHLRVLREAELVCDVARGREREYHLDLRALAELEAFLRYLRAPSSARSPASARSSSARSPLPARSPSSARSSAPA
ncbi:MAG TPA: metalloregulator ArsR/SmtB family transcription factor, partial [Polyangiaceae bacterium]|nr:metalloregulator ArsR/SmtB family transcription factor [Polyangiaceae bacterium]